MFENIPKNWEKVALENLLEYEQPTNYIVASEEYNDSYPTPVLTAGKSFILGYTNETEGIYQNTPVIIFDDFTTESKFVDFEFKVKSSAMKILKAKDNDTLKYLYYLMQILPFNNTQHKRYWISEYSKIKIGIPKDINEVKEIVKVLDAASEIIRLRTACIESAQSLIPALFQEMFGDPINNNKNYPCESLKKLCSKIGSGATPRGGKESYLKEGISFVRSMNVHDGIFQYKDLAFINDEQAKLLDNVELQESDVLINITGASVARTCIVPKEILPARVNQHVSILRCTGRLNPYFLNVLLYFQTTKQKLLDLANSKGATREAITKQQLELFKIILPPIEQQELFAEKVQEIEAYIKTQQAELENAKAMFQSLLHHAFTGELTRHKFGGDANG